MTGPLSRGFSFGFRRAVGSRLRGNDGWGGGNDGEGDGGGFFWGFFVSGRFFFVYGRCVFWGVVAAFGGVLWVGGGFL